MTILHVLRDILVYILLGVVFLGWGVKIGRVEVPKNHNYSDNLQYQLTVLVWPLLLIFVIFEKMVISTGMALVAYMEFIKQLQVKRVKKSVEKKTDKV